MLRYILPLAALLILVPACFAQLTLISTTPADHTVNLPTTTTFSFTFSAALDTAIRYPQGYPIGTAEMMQDSMIVENYMISADLRTITFSVQLTANTDFTILLLTARSATGQLLDHPHALNFSTRRTSGIYSVSGNITMSGNFIADAVVGLFTYPPFGNDGGRLEIGSVSGTGGNYTLSSVRPGVYYPICALDANHNGDIRNEDGDGIGFYDPNHDGHPDSIVVSNSLTAINLVMSQARPITARTQLPQVLQMAHQLDSAAVLLAVMSGDSVITPDGRAWNWGYLFANIRAQRNFMIGANSLSMEMDTNRDHLPQFPPGMQPMPIQFIDSDSALAIAEREGGGWFRANTILNHVNMMGGNLTVIVPGPANQMSWVVIYQATMNDEDTTLVVGIDMLTGAVLTNDVRETPVRTLPTGFAITAVSPNPFNSTTTIHYELVTAQTVRAAIYDLEGRFVTTLMNGRVSAGSGVLHWNATGVASGVYLLRMQAGQQIVSRKLVLVK